MEALTKLEQLYATRDQVNEQISKIESILGTEPGEVKTRKTRGPNKPKTEIPQTQM